MLLLVACQPAANTEQSGIYEGSCDNSSDTLQLQLTQAADDMNHLQQKVELLKEEIAYRKIAAIRAQVASLRKLMDEKKQPAKDPGELFLKERKELDTIIDSHPAIAKPAQETLDEILTLITHLSNDH